MTPTERTGLRAVERSEPQPTLLFIPDISGFTRFVSETEISHSRHIIAELLEVLIDADKLGLTVSEIEGDAILFYRPGRAPATHDLLAQVEAMFLAFHSHLRHYDSQRICQCGACGSATELELKFVAHYGPVADERIKSHAKLFGRDVILAHRLLKNEVPGREYLLMTESLLEAAPDGADLDAHAWGAVVRGAEDYDVGTVTYRHLSLEPLRERVPEPAAPDPGLARGILVTQHHEVVEAPLSAVFDALADLSFRHEWQEDLVGSDGLNHAIMQEGSTHRCVIKANDRDPFWVAHQFETGVNRVGFTETEGHRRIATVYDLEAVGPSTTRIEAYYYMEGGWLRRLAFALFIRRGLEAGNAAGFARLKGYCEELVRTGREHPVRIVLDLPESASG